jgi:ATP-dependent Clp protease ATP-binding subunit ClpA
MKSIVILQLSDFITRLEKLGITLSYDARVVTHIVEETFNPEYGARPVRRYIQEMIEDPIADAMVERKIKKTVRLSLVKKALSFTWK